MTEIKLNDVWEKVANKSMNPETPDGPLEVIPLDTTRLKQFDCHAYRKGNVVQLYLPIAILEQREQEGGEYFLFFIPGVVPKSALPPDYMSPHVTVRYDSRKLWNVCAYLVPSSWYPEVEQQYGVSNGTIVRFWINTTGAILVPFNATLNVGGTFICEEA